VCLSWQRRIDRYSRKLEQAKNDPGKYYIKNDARSLPLRIDIAKRVLKEFRWREDGLRTDSTDDWHVDALVNILAEVSRSKFLHSTNRLIPQMSPQSRHLIYEVLLDVVENIPTLDPIINDGWGRWYHDRAFDPHCYKQAMEMRELEKAYWDSPQGKTQRDLMRKKVQRPLPQSSNPK
jgi:hypothetical protein